jgi:hypothetical protein
MRRKRASRAWPGESEKAFMESIIAAAIRLGYDCVYHTHNSQHSASGFPDLVIMGRGRAFYYECKSDDPNSNPTEDQLRWLQRAREAGHVARVIRPVDRDDVYRELAGDWLREDSL